MGRFWAGGAYLGYGFTKELKPDAIENALHGDLINACCRQPLATNIFGLLMLQIIRIIELLIEISQHE